jgi:hypothetical protein
VLGLGTTTLGTSHELADAVKRVQAHDTVVVGLDAVSVVVAAVEASDTAVMVGKVSPPDASLPMTAERLLRWALPLKEQAPVLGDLAEMHAEARATFGEAEARRLYWWHAIRSIAPVVMRWSVVATIAEWLWRRFGS